MSATLIAGHRGAAGLAPENTLESFQLAVELGVRILELDVHLTRDGVPICCHDPRLDRITGTRGRLADLDWEAVAALPVMPGAFQGRFPEARIPRLEDVLRTFPAECRFLVELKREMERPGLLVAQTLEAMDRAEAAPRCRIISFEQDLLRQVAACRGGSRARPTPGPALGVLAGPRDPGSLPDRAREVGAVALHPHHSMIDAGFMDAARDGGFRVNAWTVNTPEEARRLVLLGVDEITTDYPDRIRVDG